MLHAKLSPSGASRWAVCPASVKVCEQYENKSNAAAEWGTTVHNLGEMILKDELFDSSKYDDEQIAVAVEYADYCKSLITKNSVIMIEERFNLEFIAPNTFGTGDCTILDNDGVLHIVDLKTGHNIVYAEDNLQLKLYALGAIHELQSIYEIKSVRLHIVQNRIGHIDTWDTTMVDMEDFKSWIIRRAELALSDNAPFNPEEKACKWCPHQANCEALYTHVNSVIGSEFDDLDKLTPPHIKKVLDNADLICNFVKAVEAYAVEAMEGGASIEGYKLVEARTNRKWIDEEKVADYFNGVESAFVKKLKPMTQILKEFKNDKEELEAMIVKPQGATVIAKVSDKRPAINSTHCEFGDLD